MTDEQGNDDNIEYFPSNRTVRVVVAVSSNGSRKYDEWSFEEWATYETADAAKPRAKEVAAERLGTDEFDSGVGKPPDSADSDDVVVWLRLTTHVENGELVSAPTVSLRELVQQAPRSVDATVSLRGDTFSRSVPVYADRLGAGGGDEG